MTPERRLESELPEILADRYLGPSPAYRESILARTVGTRQRPAWTFLERWLPMSAITLRSPMAPPVSWRPIAYVMLLLALALAIGLGAIIASRPRLPPPYGPAANGGVVYASGGDIYIGDPTTGATRVIVSGPEVDNYPAFSHDGTKLAFLRQSGGESRFDLVVAASDGSDPRVVTPEPLTEVTGGDWTADARFFLLVSSIGGRPTMSIIDVPAATLRILDVGMAVREATFQPPRDDAIAFIGEDAEGDGLYVMDRDGSERPRLLVTAPRSKTAGGLSMFLASPAFSPDGSRIAYVLGDELVHRVHIINADGTGDFFFDHPPGVLYQNYPAWSPNGSELVVSRTYAGGSLFAAAILPADGGGMGSYVGPALTADRAAFSWSPDGASIVVTFEPLDAGGPRRAALLVDADDGSFRDLLITESWFDWQRVVHSPATATPNRASESVSPFRVDVGASLITGTSSGYDQAWLIAPDGTRIIFRFTNNAPSGAHNVAIRSALPNGRTWVGLPLAEPGETVDYLAPALAPGTFTIYCTVDPRMTGTLFVD